MKTKLLTIAILFCALFGVAQNGTPTGNERFGHTFNFGVGIGGYSGYYGYLNRSLPVLHFDYEFDVAPNFTLAPFVNFYTNRGSYFWGNKKLPERYYVYRETVIPVGIKALYYFDRLVQAGPSWDFYAGGSLGFAVVHTTWESGYYGDRHIIGGAGALFLDLHVGTEYHFNNRMGVTLDLSSGVSTVGLAFHH